MKKLMLLGGIRYLLPAIEAAHRRGCYVITVDYLPNNIAHKYSDEFHNVSILDKEKILKLAINLKIDGILSYAVDPGVVTAAYVAEQLGLPFTCSYEVACILQNKVLFRQFLSENSFNVPDAKGYKNVEQAIKEIDTFNYPVIVKPVDSAGSKGVSLVSSSAELKNAISFAVNESHNGHFIIEQFLDLDGSQSSADCFSVNGNLVYADFSDQQFDSEASNPFTPSMEIWPSTMPLKYQANLTSELQRLLSLLHCQTGLYNVESRVCKNGKAYLMEVSPRAGGNRIAELQRIATGVDLIDAEICKAINEPIPNIISPEYNAIYVNDILHVKKDGVFGGVEYDESFKKNHLIDVAIYPIIGERVRSFRGANDAIGSIFLKFKNKDELSEYCFNRSRLIKSIVV